MAKFFKSIFNSADRKKGSYEGDGDDEKSSDSPPPMDGKRQLSISRSGRMRQAHKKRHSLTLELYGDTIHIEKPASLQYHVHNPVNKTAPIVVSKDNRLNDASDARVTHLDNKATIDNVFQVSLEEKLKALALDNGNKSPEEEIDTAFEIIDKS